MQDITSKFTNHLKNVLTRALCLVIETHDETIRPIHLLWALSSQEGCVAAEILAKAGITKDQFSSFGASDESVKNLPAIKTQTFIPILSEESKSSIEKAVLAASSYEHRYVGTEHMLFGLLELNSAEIEQFFTNNDINKKRLQRSLNAVFHTTASFPEIQEKQKQGLDFLDELEKTSKNEVDEDDEEEEQKTPALDYFTEELTDPEFLKDIHPAVGREQEIKRIVKILSRRQKNNPILVGEPGVGKTAIIEGLAKQIEQGKVPDVLAHKRILRLDLAGMIAGTMYRGEFESRLRQLIDEINDQEDIILFIDEVHTIMGAGAASGSLDAANILKPALARGEIRCIGATTPSEYKKHIEVDGALERRFQQVLVKEPTLKETRAILQGVKSYFEEFHAVKYEKDAIESALLLAEKYIHSKQFPDKAIDIIDESGAAANITRPPSKIRENLRKLQKERADLIKKKRNAVREEKFVDAMEYKALEEQLDEKIDKIKSRQRPRKEVIVTVDLIHEVISELTGIPVSKLSTQEHKQLAKLDTELKKRVIGQDSSVERVADAIRRAKLGIANPDKPLASFLFLGPSGVGKTELAKAVAETVFGRKEAFLRIDMSEYAEPHTISKLIGSPAGYVGYRETTSFTDHIKAHPHSVILLDELEKAHTDVHNLLLQLLDEGILTDATGRKIDFRHSIIIMTSNIGREQFEQNQLGFSEGMPNDKALKHDLRKRLEERFKPEFLNRISHTCVFHPLAPKTLQKIAQIKLKRLSRRVDQKGINLTFASPVSAFLTGKTNPRFGARDIERLIEEEIEHALANYLLAQVRAPKTVHISLKGEKIQLTKGRK